MLNFRASLLSLFCALALAACSGSDAEPDANTPAEKVEVIYGRASEKFDNKDYKGAVEDFLEVERQYPYSEWAPRAQIMAGYANYRAQKYDDAVSTFERYVKLYPGSESAAYAYYMIALSYYEQITDVGRDQKVTEQALQALREVVRRSADTSYARDAKLKLDLAVDHLAGKEMAVGRYYLQRDEYLAAINRFRTVVESYQTTTHVPEALHRLVECYLRLGVTDEARRYAAVLGYNFPASSWYRDSYALLEEKGLKPDESAVKDESLFRRLVPGF